MAEFTKLIGLDHFEGRTDIYVQSAGMVQGPFTVTGGQITLIHPVVRGFVGIGYAGELRTLPYDGALAGQRGRSPRRTLDRVQVEYSGFGGDVSVMSNYFDESDGNPGARAELPTRKGNDITDQAEPDFYRTHDTEITGQWDDEEHVRVRTAIGLPFQLHTIEYTGQANG